MSKGTKRSTGSVDLGWDDPGTNLESLFERSISAQASGSAQPGKDLEGARELPIELVDHNPYQARQAFDVDALQELAESVREHGVIEPIIVRPVDGVDGRYEIIAGERRYRATQIAGLATIPAIIREMDARQAAIITALENLQREDLDIEDEGRQFAYLQQLMGLSQRKLGQMLGKERQYISRRIRLLKRPDLLKEYRSGLKTLHQVLSQVGSDVSDVDETSEEGMQNGTAGPTPDIQEEGSEEQGDLIMDATESGSRGPILDTDLDADIELVERDELSGYIVARSSSSDRRTGSAVGGARGGTRFRWRPLQQFSTWVARMKPDEVPADERASVKAQVAEIKVRLEQLEKALEDTEALSASQ